MDKPIPTKHLSANAWEVFEFLWSRFLTNSPKVSAYGIHRWIFQDFVPPIAEEGLGRVERQRVYNAIEELRDALDVVICGDKTGYYFPANREEGLKYIQLRSKDWKTRMKNNHLEYKKMNKMFSDKPLDLFGSEVADDTKIKSLG